MRKYRVERWTAGEHYELRNGGRVVYASATVLAGSPLPIMMVVIEEPTGDGRTRKSKNKRYEDVPLPDIGIQGIQGWPESSL